MKKQKKKEKHWFDRLPKVYQQLVYESFKKEYPNRTKKDLKEAYSLLSAFTWLLAGWEGCHDFFAALHFSLKGVNNADDLFKKY